MILTEEEAKTKWCPHARQAHFERDFDMSAVIAANRTDDGTGRDAARATTPCIASGCMAWRWDVEPPLNKDLDPNKYGYCGLAGAP